jgi:serine/threonine protein kinase/Tfp pilus assembly protein PilF
VKWAVLGESPVSSGARPKSSEIRMEKGRNAMDAERWAVIDSLYHAALAKEPGERSSYLAAACAEDPALRSEIESLLGYADAKLSSPIEASRMTELLDKIRGIAASDGVEPVGLAVDGMPPALPPAIGRYRILRLLGEGGMGTVYEAEQEHPRRRVALKVIKPGLARAELLRRFGQESQALGRLQHPGIAQIYEAGTADTGFGPQPYLAMEFIRGESLLEYAKAHELNTRQRLELMAKVCEAVHHAHQRGIIHRDLKPGNTLVDESGQPKVLDFGVARVTDSDALATRQTDIGCLVGTLAYMSPEQVLADPLDLDTRSDVYALGVMLYELLVGKLPYTLSRNLPEALQTIRKEDPARLSSVSRNYRGDIETIVAKALEKDKARRYASAAGLAGDIRRYLEDEPIIARPPTATYQLQKFARRHKAVVAGVAAVFVVLVAGIIVSTWEAARANSEAATAKAVNDFLQNGLLAQASANTQTRPDTKPDPDLKVRTALDRAAARIAGKFKEQPLVEAAIRQTIGNTYAELGLYPEAQRQMELAVEFRRHLLGAEHRDTLQSINFLAVLYLDQGKYAQAEPLFTKVLQGWRRDLGKENPDTLNAMSNLAWLYLDQGKYAQAEPLYTTILKVERRVLGEEHADTLMTMHSLAWLYREQGKYAQSEPLFTKVLEVRQRVLGEEHPDTLITLNNLARLYRYEGKYAQAEPLYIKTVELQRRALGPEHPDTLISINNLALLYQNEGEYAKSEPLFTKVLEVRQRVLGPEHPDTLISINNLAWEYQGEGKYAKAQPLYTKVLDLQRRLLGEEHPTTLIIMNNLAGVYREEGSYALAEALYTRVLELQHRVLGTEHPRRLSSMNDLALLYVYQSKYPEAEGLLREAVDGYQKTNSDTWDRYRCQSLLGVSLAGQKKYPDAEPLLLSGYEGMLQKEATIPAAKRAELSQSGEWIVRLYQDWGKPGKAAEWRGKLQASEVRPVVTSAR